MLKNLNLVKRFLIFSALSVIVAGFVLVQTVGYLYRLYFVNDAMRSVVYTINSSMQSRVNEKGSLEAVVGDRIFLKGLADNLVKYNDVVSIKLWSIDGTIIYCTEEELIGKRFNIEKELKEALEGKPSHSVTELEEKENEHLKANNDKLIEIYYPVENENGKVIGSFEIYKSYERIKEYDHSMTIYIWLIIFGGLLILYMLLFRSIRSAYLTLRRQNNELKEVNNELQRSYLDTIEAFSTAVDLKDSYTKDHSSRVTEYSLMIAKEMNLGKERVVLLQKAALFHDVGKIGIPDAILKKEGKLTDEEYALIKQHPTMGAKLIESVNFLHEVIPFIKGHHERIDGKGYPEGLKGNEIPLEARIIAVADTFDAMTSDRPYRNEMDFETAITELQRVSGTQLDGELVEIFINVLRKNHPMLEIG